MPRGLAGTSCATPTKANPAPSRTASCSPSVPDLMLEGMTIAGYAVGSDTGIVYLRGEYRYLLPFLESVVEERRRQGLLGRDILGKAGFDFDDPFPARRGSLCVRRGDGAHQLVRRAARRSEKPAPVPAAEGLPRGADDRQQRGDLLLRLADHDRRGRLVRRHGFGAHVGHEGAQHLRRLPQAGRLRGSLRDYGDANCWT